MIDNIMAALALPGVSRLRALPHLDRDEERRIALRHIAYVRVARGHVRGEAFNPRRLPDCRLVPSGPASFLAPRSYSVKFRPSAAPRGCA